MANQSKPSVLKGFIISGVAASSSHCVCHPLYTLKNNMMYLGDDFIFKDFLKRSWKEPKKFLYSGMGTRAIGIMPEKAMKMQTAIWVQRYLNGENEDSNVYKTMISGAFAGAATTVVGCPSERAMVLANVRQQGFMRVVRETGVSGLYKGWTTTLYRDIIFNFCMFTCRDIFVRQYKEKTNTDPSAVTRVGLGIPAGMIAAFAGLPNDVIKTRMQGRPLNDPYVSCWGHFKSIVKNEGPKNLFKGAVPRLIAVPQMMSLFFVFNEELEKRFK